MKFLIVEPSPLLISSLLGPNIRLRILFSNTLSLDSSLNVRDHVSQPYSTNNNINDDNNNDNNNNNNNNKQFTLVRTSKI